MLRILPEHGGETRLSVKGYLVNAPELVVEIAASSASMDTREKLVAYRRARVREYLVWRTEDEAVDWWHLDEDEFVALPLDSDGVIRGQVFPGLWLRVDALLAEDGARVLETLHRGLASPEHTAFRAALTQKRGA